MRKITFIAAAAILTLAACDEFQPKAAPAPQTTAPVEAAPAFGAVPAEVSPTDPVRSLVQAALDADIRRMLDEPSKVNVEIMRGEGDWIFASGPAVMPDGAEIDLSKTALSGPARNGMMDGTNVVALLKRKNGVWAVTVSAVGSTDVPQVEWPKRYGVSPALVGQEEAEGGE